MLGLARVLGQGYCLLPLARLGDPKLHPQPEHYCGNVNTIGPRAITTKESVYRNTVFRLFAYAHTEIRIARIFNTYGPRMLVDDGRVVSNFIVQALRVSPLRFMAMAPRADLFVM